MNTTDSLRFVVIGGVAAGAGLVLGDGIAGFDCKDTRGCHLKSGRNIAADWAVLALFKHLGMRHPLTEEFFRGYSMAVNV